MALHSDQSLEHKYEFFRKHRLNSIVRNGADAAPSPFQCRFVPLDKWFHPRSIAGFAMTCS